MTFVDKYNLWWPDYEDDPMREIPRMLSRVNDCDVVASHVRTKGVAVQAGGHVGLWARQLAKHFTMVYSFEPMQDGFSCLLRNTQFVHGLVIGQQALSHSKGTALISPRGGGRSAVTDYDDRPDVEEVQTITIDSLQLPRCDLLYLDIEGHELEALKGAVDTLRQFRPVVVLEVLKGREQLTIDWANAAGYSIAGKCHADWIFKWGQ